MSGSSRSPAVEKSPPHAAEAAREKAIEMGFERLVFFSDGVFAIAVTLLALEIRLPAGAELRDDSQLLAQLIHIWPKYLGYFISFMVIGIFWMAHHRKFSLIRGYDRRLMFLNLLFLMVIAFIPFPTGLISEYQSPTPTIFYALTMIVGELLLLAIWGYASGPGRLTGPDLDPKVRRRQFIVPVAASLVFALSIGVALWDPGLAKFIWFLILPASLYFGREK